MIFAGAVLLAAFAFAETGPASAAPVSAASAPVTAPVKNLENVKDFGSLDIEMTMVNDFSELDLAALLDAKVETASRKSEPISKAPAIIEVLTRKQLLELGARDLYTALTFLPGIEVLESYNGYTTFIFRGQLQEIYNAKILLLVNGHPSYEAVNSSFYLELVPLEAIDRIEVVRGPGSVLYGSNAFAGVINVITKTQADDGVSANARIDAGSFRTLNGGAGARGRNGDLSWALYSGGQTTKGYPYRVRPGQNEECVQGTSPVAWQCDGVNTIDYFNNHASVFADTQWRGLRVQGGILRQDKQKYAIVPVYRYHGPNGFDHYWGDASYRHEWGTVTVAARGAVDQSHRMWQMGRFPNADSMHAFVDNKTTVLRGEAMLTWQAFNPLQLDAGVNYDNSTGDYYDVKYTDGTLHPLSPKFDVIPTQISISGFLQATWRPASTVTVLAGNRTTRFQSDRLAVTPDPKGGAPTQRVVSDEPSVNNSPRAAVVWAPMEQLVFKALYGAAFRTPNHFEESAVMNQVIGTSEDLKPETIRTAELGVDTRPHERVSLRANTYYSLTDRLIVRRPPTTQEAIFFGKSATVFDNAAGQRITGVEVSARTVLNEQWTGFANGAFKEAFSRRSGKAVRDVSHFSGSAGVSFQPARWAALRPNAQYFGKRGNAGAYWLANAVADFPVTEWLTLSAIAENLTDRHYDYPEYVRQVVATTPGGPGRAFYGRAQLEF